MKAEQYFRLLQERLSTFTEAPAHEARDILEAVKSIDDRAFPLFLISGSILPEDEDKIETILARREKNEPLAYILNRSWFYGLPFYVTSDTLIPQADTEIVTEQAIRALPAGGSLLDICTGSGCIALAALANTEKTSALALDLSEKALAVAKENAERLSLSHRFEAKKADVFAKDFLKGAGLFDVIVSNPPYIRTDVIPTLSPEVQSEPHMALDGGKDGLLFYRRLLEVCPAHLKKGGKLLFEIGYDQKEALTRLCENKAVKYEFYRDFGGNDRVLAISL